MDLFATNKDLRRKFADWVRNDFNHANKKMKDNLKTLLSPYIDSVTAESIISKRQFYQYLRVMRNQIPIVMDRYIKAMIFNPDGNIDLVKTSDNFLSTFDLKKYRKGIVNEARKNAFERSFSPGEMETLLKFSPKGIIRAIEFMQNPAYTTSGDLNQLEIYYLNTLSTEELAFLKNLTPNRMKEIREFVTTNAISTDRQYELLKLTRNERQTLFKTYRMWWIRNGVDSFTLPTDKQLNPIFSTLTQNEWYLLKSIVPLTDSEITKLTTEDINTIVKNPKLRKSNVLKKFLTLDERERKIINNFDMEIGKDAETLSSEGKLLITVLYGPSIQAFVAPIIWRREDLNEFKIWFQEMKIQPWTWTDRLNYANLLAIAMTGEKTNQIHDIADWLRNNKETTFFYYLRAYQFTGWMDIREKIRWCRFPTIHGPIFDLKDQEDLRFFTWVLNDFDPIKEINLGKFIIWTLLRSDNEPLIESMRNRLKSNEYKLTKDVLFFQNERTEWLAEILTPEDTFEFFHLDYNQALHDKLKTTYPNRDKPILGLIDVEEVPMLTISLAHDLGDPLPLLRRLKDHQLTELFLKNPISLIRRTIAIGRVDILEFFYYRVSGLRHLFVNNASEMFSAFTASLNEAGSRGFSGNTRRYNNILRYFLKIDVDLYRLAAQFYLTMADQLYAGNDDKIYRLFNNLDNPNDVLLKNLENFNPDLHQRLVARLPRGCANDRSKRDLSINCVDSRNKRINLKKLPHILNKGASTAGFIYTVFLIGKHIANGNVKGLGYDTLNLWIMPKFGETITERIIQAGLKFESNFMRNAAPVMGRIIGNFAAFLGLFESIKEYNNATDVVDKKIADLHIITNSVYLIADLPAVVAGVMSGSGCQVGLIGAYAGPLGLTVSVGVLILADFIESAYQVDKLSEQIQLTADEKSRSYWRSFFGKSIDEHLKRDIEAKHVYESYIRSVLTSFGDKYDKIVISLPDILVTQREHVHKTGPNFLTKLWYWSFIFCMGEKEIVHLEFDFENPLAFHTSMTNVGLTSRIILNNFNGYHLKTDSNYNNVYVRGINTTILPVPSSERCGFMRLNSVMDIKETVEEWYFPKHLITYEKSSNLSSTLYFIPALEFTGEFSPSQSTDLYFSGIRINIRDSSGVGNNYYFTNELTDCTIENEGRNYLYVLNDNFNCQLIGNNVILGSEHSERFNISYANYLDGRGGNDTIIANNNSIVRSYWGDSIRGKTITILPLNVDEINNIVYDNGLIVYNNDNRTIKIYDNSTLMTLDSFILNPIKLNQRTVTDLHLHKILQENIILEEKLNELKSIYNSNFKMVKQLSSLNYEIILGDTGNNIFYPNTYEDSMNFYWEGNTGTRHVYLLDGINANITISRANGLLDFQLLKNPLNETVIEESGDITIVNGRLRLKILNNYEDLTFGMDGKYYKLRNGVMEEDYCSHPLRIKGRMKVESSHLKNYHNCLEFQSDDVLFFKSGRDLILQSGQDLLLIPNYDSNEFDLSLRLKERILTPVEFRDRTKRPNTLMTYKIKKQFEEIYHNQPTNNNDIGIIDMSDKSILNFNGKMKGRDLHLKHNYTDSIVIRNWLTYPQARQVMFIFQDCSMDNEKCIVNECKPEYVLNELQGHKDRIKGMTYDNELCTNNMTLVYFLLKYYLDLKYPLLKTSDDEKNICAEAYEIVEKFEEMFKFTAQEFGICLGEIDCWNLYTNVMDEIKNQRYFGLPDVLYSTAKGIVPGNEEFYNVLKDLIEVTFI